MEMILIAFLPIEFILGWIACHAYYKSKKIGKMIIDTTDPNKDIIRIEYSKPLSEIINKESVVLKIETKV